ncbi:hypothetical protein [Faecalibacterium hattorii]
MRVITAEGKSTCRINECLPQQPFCGELCGGLININGQHDSVGESGPP